MKGVWKIEEGEVRLKEDAHNREGYGGNIFTFVHGRGGLPLYFCSLVCLLYSIWRGSGQLSKNRSSARSGAR